MITKKYYKVIRVSHADSGYLYIHNLSNEIGEFSFLKQNSPSPANFDTQYSLDGVNWTSYDFTNRPTVSVNPGSKIYFRGTKIGGYGGGNHQFTYNFNKSYKIGGNLLSIQNYNTMTTDTTIGAISSELSSLFMNQTNLIYADELNFGNANTIYTFAQFFYGCSSLESLPDFSNITTLTNNNTFTDCFNECSSLTIGPDFSNITSVTNRAFSYCFAGCAHLSTVTAPNVQDLNTSLLDAWLANYSGSQATGTKVVNVPTGATITTNSTNGIPTGWTRVDY